MTVGTDDIALDHLFFYFLEPRPAHHPRYMVSLVRSFSVVEVHDVVWIFFPTIRTWFRFHIIDELSYPLSGFFISPPCSVDVLLLVFLVVRFGPLLLALRAVATALSILLHYGRAWALGALHPATMPSSKNSSQVLEARSLASRDFAV